MIQLINKKKLLAVLLTLIMIVTMLPVQIFAATVNTGVTGLSANSSGDASWSYSNGSITGSVSAEDTSPCSFLPSYSAQNGTLTFSNDLGQTALLSFNYEFNLQGGSILIDGASVTAGGVFNKKLNAGETVAVKITSNSNNANAATVTLSNLKLTNEIDVNITFEVPVHGSYTVNGDPITVQTVKTFKTTDSVSVSATPDSGYRFMGWHNISNDGYFSFSANTTTSFLEDSSVVAEFISNDSTTAMFQVGLKVFSDLNDAIDYSVNSGISKIALLTSGILPSGSYTIPSGKVLVIPFDEGQTVYTTVPGLTTKDDGTPAAHETPSAYRTLTMESGANIIIASGGAISVPSKLSSVGQNDGSWNGTPTGKHGRIDMIEGSSIDVQNGGNLYVYGYISGSGNVYARSGSQVWECFQIRSWRGGSATLSLSGNGQKVFPINQYYVQNIEAPITYYAGAAENVYTAVNMSSTQYGASATFIGNGGMFNLTSGSVTKNYTGTSDRLELDIDGDFSINPLALTIEGVANLNTSEYVLPIQSNITINVNSGNMTINQDVAFMPGSELCIAKGANVTVSSACNAYVYDKDEWGSYAASGLKLVPVGYSTVNGTTAKRNANSLVDVKIDVNGTLTATGYIYTTEGGAAIISSEKSGQYIQLSAPGDKTNTYMATQSGTSITYVSVPITPAQLKNGDDSYTETAGSSAGTTFFYCETHDKWETGESFILSYDANGGEGNMQSQQLCPGGGTVAENSFSYSGHSFKEWNTRADGNGVAYNPGDPITITQDTVLYAQWNSNTFTITFYDDDETTVLYETEVEAGVTPEYAGPQPTKGSTAQYEYTFSGWNKEIVPATENTSYIAVYSATVRKYDIIFKDEDGTVLDSQNLAYGAMPVYAGETPTKDSTAQYDYVFAGWDPAITTVTGNAEYTASYSSVIRAYTVTFKNEDGTVLSSEQYDYGTPVSGITVPADPEKEGDVQYSYTFAGWTPALAEVTADATYTATYTQSVNNYTVTFTKEDGTAISSTEYPYGTPAASIVRPDAPEKEGDAQYSYTFAGWDPEITDVTGNATYKATYTQSVNSYTVTFKNEDGTVLDTQTLPYGSTPVYGGETPEKESTAQYDYTFAGWTPAIGSVTGDTVYTAMFSSTVRSYDITFKNWDGSELAVISVSYGQTPAYEGTPVREATAQYSYTFTGWSPELAPVTGSTEYTAQYNETVNSYVITFYDENGTTILDQQTLPYGETPVYAGQTPVKTGDDQYSYTFAGWDPEIAMVTGTASYKATYTQSVNSYTVSFVNWNDELLETNTYLYGATPEYSGETPVKEGDAQYSYTFAGWDHEITAVTENTTYKATYTQSLNSYTVTWKNDNGDVIDTETYEYGQIPSHDAPAKENTAQYTYTFSGWDPALAAVTGDAEYTATYTSTVNSYVITFFDEDGETVLDQQTLPYGATPVYAGEPPVKEQTAQYSYSFTGWDPGIVEVTGNASYTAVYEQILNSYEITWVNGDGTVLRIDTVEYGQTPSYSPDPVLPSTAQYDYTFSGWNPAIEQVTGNATYTATYTPVLRSYLIRFFDEDGESLLYSAQVEYGTVPVYGGETPEKASDAQYTYTFAGWNPALCEVSGPADYVATYTNVTNKYTVEWHDWDGALLKSKECEYGTVPVYDGEQPTRENTAQYTYTFAGWTPEVTEVTGNASYTAVYDRTVNKYTVSFLNEDGEVIYSADFEYGQIPVCGAEIPEKPATAQYTYTFDGWTPEITTVTGPAQYVIKYKATLNSYTVTFYDENGTTVLQSGSVEYGTMPEYTGETPEKEGDAQYSYTFSGWNPDLTAVTGDADYTAVYDRSVNTYTVTWKNDSGDVIDTETYEYGQTPVHDAPSKENTAQYTYTFAGWSPAIVTVTEDAVYTATFNATVNTYTVTFRDDSENVLFSKVYSYGDVPAYEGDEVTKEATVQYSYVFAGWSDGETVYTGTLPAVTGNTAYTAVFDSTVNSYTISFVNWNDELLETGTYQYGATPAYSGDTPVKEGDAQYSYTFDGWDSEISEVTGDKTYKAVYTQTVNEYTVTFKAENGTVLAEEKYKYDTVPVYTGTIPVKEGTEEHIYSFAGFSDGENIYDGALPEVKADVTYTCAYDTWEMPVWTWNSETSCSVSFASESGHDPFTPEVSALSTEGTGADYGMAVTTASAIGPDGKTYTSVNKAENTITVTLQTPQNQPVLVRISRNGSPAMSVIIPRGSTSVTIYRVPFGNYTVSEGSENWRLTDSSETAAVSAEQRHPEFVLVPVAKEDLTNLWRVTLNVFELG